jgi:hypothetical protein
MEITHKQDFDTFTLVCDKCEDTNIDFITNNHYYHQKVIAKCNRCGNEEIIFEFHQ